jgi:two-component system, cell cycle sensor histidine kinase and response regulator CckA
MTTRPEGQSYRAIFEGAIQFTGLLDPNGTVLEANPAALAFCAARREDVVGLPFWATPWWTGNPAEQARVREAVQQAIEGRTVGYEVGLHSSKGMLTTFDFSLTPVGQHEGTVSHIIFEARDITGRKRAEQALQETLARHQAVLASALDPVITIDGYGIIQSASRSVERVFGYRPEELIGRNISLLMPEPHRSMHDHYLANYRRTGQTNILGRTREFEAMRKDGVRVPIELSVSRVDVPGQMLPLFTGIIHDLSERKRAEREIALLQSLALAISESGSLQEALSLTIGTICEAAGWDYGEVWLPAPGSVPEALHPALVWARPGCGFERLQRAAEGLLFPVGRGLPGRVWAARRTVWVGDLPSLPPDEFRRRDVAIESGITAVVGVPILTADEPVAALLFFLKQDQNEAPRLLDLVTAAAAPLGNAIRRRQAEEELQKHRQHLEQLVAERTMQLQSSHEQLRLADRLAAIGTLAAGLGHDMNNVLLPVRCRLDALEAIELPQDVRDQFKAVRSSVLYLQQLSDGLHLLALDPEDQEASEGTTDLEEWWTQIGALLGKAVPKRVFFDIDLEPNMPLVAVAPHRLTQAVLNLVVNAGEAIVGGGRVRVWARAGRTDGTVQVGVTDDGEGMTEEVKQRALDPFFTTKTRGLGTGLGLSLVRGVVQGAGGSIAIDSAPLKGTTVTLTFPAVSRAPLLRTAQQNGLSANVSLKDARTAAFVTALLGSAGIQVEPSSSSTGIHSTLWVTEHSTEALKTAKTYLREPGRQVVVLGQAPHQWNSLGAIVVPASDDFEQIREAITEAAAAAAGDH